MRSCLLALLLFAAPAIVAASETSDPLTVEIEAFLATYAGHYNRQDYARLLEMWDRAAPEPIYMAEEIDPPMHGWKLIDAYFARPGVLTGIRNEYTRVRAQRLAPDLALATYRLRFDIAVRGMQPLSSWDRVMAVFRQRDGQWKLVAYAEAPMAPLTMVRRMLAASPDVSKRQKRKMLKDLQQLMQDAVPTDFAAWLQDQAGEQTGEAAGERVGP
jgi:ketosteroid isomerase-like protein